VIWVWSPLLALRHEQNRRERLAAAFVERHVLFDDGKLVQKFEAELTDFQRQVLGLLGVPQHAFRLPT